MGRRNGSLGVPYICPLPTYLTFQALPTDLCNNTFIMAFGGAALKFIQTFLYALEFCCAGIILGIYSYFLSVLADRDAPIYTWAKAVEGISGAAVLYTIFAVLLTCC